MVAERQKEFMFHQRGGVNIVKEPQQEGFFAEAEAVSGSCWAENKTENV